MRGERSTQRSANGADSVRFSALATAGGPYAYDDPMSKVLGLDAKVSSYGALVGFTSGGTLLMVGIMALISIVAWLHTVQDRAASAPGEIDIMREEAPPPPPPAAKPEPEQKPEPAAPPPRAAPKDAPPPAPAQAGKVLTQEPDPNEPVDLTGNTIVTGNADAYAGGVTSSNGTSATAVRALAAPAGVAGGTGAPTSTATAVAGPDRSRHASVGGAEWTAPFPPEADAAQIDDAYVMLQIDVTADGRASAVRVLSDPGNGFAREARRYAMGQRFKPELDRDGRPLAATIKVKVHFSR